VCVLSPLEARGSDAIQRIDKPEGAGPSAIGAEIGSRILDEVLGLRKAMSVLEERLVWGGAGKRPEEERGNEDNRGNRGRQTHATPGELGLNREDQIFWDEEQFVKVRGGGGAICYLVRGGGQRKKFGERF